MQNEKNSEEDVNVFGDRNVICRCAQVLAFGLVVFLATAMQAQVCRKLVLTGEVNAGQEWRKDIGEGWVFRLVPIVPGVSGYSGWDLVVDRLPPAGFPDALLLATPPYGSLNEREVGTTFGLRAQDAVGWNLRSFHFLTDIAAFREAQGIYMQMVRNGRMAGSQASQQRPDGRAVQRLMELAKRSSPGELRIEDARLTAGIADAATYAESWAINSARTRHESEAPSHGKPTSQGELHWMRFTLTLWLPASWRSPDELHAVRGACAE